MPLARTRQFLRHDGMSETLSAYDNHRARTHKSRAFDGTDERFASLKGRRHMQACHLLTRRIDRFEPVDGWRDIDAPENAIAKIAGYNREDSKRAAVTGTTQRMVVGATGLGVCTGAVVASSAVSTSAARPSLRALHAHPRNADAPEQLTGIIRQAGAEGLPVMGAIAGGMPDNRDSARMAVAVKQVFANEGVVLAFDDTLPPDRPLDTVYGTVVARLDSRGRAVFGNHVKVVRGSGLR